MSDSTATRASPDDATQPKKAVPASRRPQPSFGGFIRDMHGHVCYLLVVYVFVAHYWFGMDMSHFLFLSYFNPATDSYGMGANDALFVAFWVIALTALRLAVQGVVFYPLGWIMGCPPSDMTKFVEMGWQCAYYASAWACGVYLAFFSDEAFVKFDGFWEDTVHLWRGYPHLLSGNMKLYYLMQTAFWSHMVFVTLIEKWRKDFVQMMAHHVVTLVLLLSSYSMGYFRNGTLVLVNQDAADIFLPMAKMLKYCKLNRVADAVFAFFSIVWIPTRHWLFWCPVYGLLVHAPAEMTHGVGYHRLWTPVFFMTFLLALQTLLLFWLKLLLVSVHRALFKTGGIEDQRSDDEDDAPVHEHED